MQALAFAPELQKRQRRNYALLRRVYDPVRALRGTPADRWIWDEATGTTVQVATPELVSAWELTGLRRAAFEALVPEKDWPTSLHG